LREVKFMHPYPGEIVLTPHPKFDLFRRVSTEQCPCSSRCATFRLPVSASSALAAASAICPAIPRRSTSVRIPIPGEYHVYPIVEPIDERSAELVIIHPEGPGEPIDLRSSTPIGGTLVAEAKAPDGFIFVAWGGDTTSTTNPSTS
jgi:hypothetical protein